MGAGDGRSKPGAGDGRSKPGAGDGRVSTAVGPRRTKEAPTRMFAARPSRDLCSVSRRVAGQRIGGGLDGLYHVRGGRTHSNHRQTVRPRAAGARIISILIRSFSIRPYPLGIRSRPRRIGLPFYLPAWIARTHPHQAPLRTIRVSHCPSIPRCGAKRGWASAGDVVDWCAVEPEASPPADGLALDVTCANPCLPLVT
jgi:hypothetical protein